MVASVTPEMAIVMELLAHLPQPYSQSQNFLVGLDFDGWVMVRKSALVRLCRLAGVDYDGFDPTDGGRSG